MADKRKVSDIQKKLQGHDRFVKSVPDLKPIDKLWLSPRQLGDHGRELWRNAGRLLVKAKVLTELDKTAFSLMCESYQIVEAMTETLHKEGVAVPGAGGAEKAHPAISLRKAAMADLMRFMEKFGLTPKDRTQLDIATDKEPADPAREFLFGGKK